MTQPVTPPAASDLLGLGPSEGAAGVPPILTAPLAPVAAAASVAAAADRIADPVPSRGGSRFEDGLLWGVRQVGAAFRWVGGLVGMWFLLAWTATIPIVQWVALGFLVEVTARVVRGGRWRDALIGSEQGWVVCRLMFGVAVTWLPLWVVSQMRYDAWLIDPQAAIVARWRIWEHVVFGLTVVHWLGVGLTGGRLRHFFWPLLVPWYLASGLFKRVVSVSGVRALIERTLGVWFPRSLAAYYRAEPLSNWFVPAVLWLHLRQGTLLSAASARFWGWVESLHLRHFFGRGLGAFAGMILWFVGPTLWLLLATRAQSEGGELVFFILGVVHLFAALQYYPLVHCRYCETGCWSSYWQWRRAAQRYWASPLRLTLAAAATLVLTFPLWLTRIAMIPYDLWWLLSALYVLCLWPLWSIWGWAWHHACTRAIPASWSWGLTLMPLFWVLIAAQVLVTVLSIYTSWQGVFNLLLHPTFNVPTPFSPNAAM